MNQKPFIFTLLAILLCAGSAHSDGLFTESKKTVNGTFVHVANLTLHPAPEPIPAFKHRLITDPADQIDQNASIYYLKAIGFLEQRCSLEILLKKDRETQDYYDHKDPKMRRKCIGYWSDLTPDELPLEDAKKMLGLLSFQPREFAEAERCRFADFGRQKLFEMERPFEYLLPDIQSMRELARWQSVRCKVAIREGRFNDAIKILRQQYMMAMHMGQDVLLVSNLVGIAIGSIADEDLLYLVQKPDAPSLYWAIAAVPRSLCDFQRTLGVEKRMIRAYLPHDKRLHDLDHRFPEEFWVGYTEENVKKLIAAWSMEISSRPKPFSLTDLEKYHQTSAAAFIIAAYPKAKRYLIEDHKLDREKIDSFPAVRVVTMAMDLALDDLFELEQKYTVLPPAQAVALTQKNHLQMRNRALHIGLTACMEYPLICASNAACHAVIRQQQNFDIMQTIEALRIHAYNHDGKLPDSIEKLDPPAMKNPFNDEHFPYRVEDGKAILDAPGPAGYHRRYVIEMKPIEK